MSALGPCQEQLETGPDNMNLRSTWVTEPQGRSEVHARRADSRSGQQETGLDTDVAMAYLKQDPSAQL